MSWIFILFGASIPNLHALMMSSFENSICFVFEFGFQTVPIKITNQTNHMFMPSMQLNGVFDFLIKLLLKNIGLTLATCYWVTDASSECTYTCNLKNKVEDCKNMSYFMIPHRITLKKRQVFPTTTEGYKLRRWILYFMRWTKPVCYDVCYGLFAIFIFCAVQHSAFSTNFHFIEFSEII